MADAQDWDEGQLLDRAHLDAYTGGDVDLQRDILMIFMERAPGYLQDLAETQGDWRQRAHRLKGAARGIGAWNLAVTAERAEAMREPALKSTERQRVIREIGTRLEQLLTHISGEGLIG